MREYTDLDGTKVYVRPSGWRTLVHPDGMVSHVSPEWHAMYPEKEPTPQPTTTRLLTEDGEVLWETGN